MELLEQIEAYLARTNTPPSKFGRMAVGDPRLLADLKSGRRLRRRTEERLRSYLNLAVVQVSSPGAGQSRTAEQAASTDAAWNEAFDFDLEALSDLSPNQRND